MESFFQAFEALPGENLLASPDIFFNKNLEDDINAAMTNGDVYPIIERKIDESITAAFEVLRKRIDKFGVTQPNIQRIGKSARILVELPGAKDVERVKKLLQSTAQLEFWETTNVQELQLFLTNVNTIVTAEKEVESPSIFDTDSLSIDSLDLPDTGAGNPFFELMGVQYAFGARLGVVSEEDTAKVRAVAVYNYLIHNGIDKKRLRFKSFGSSKPIHRIPEKTEEERNENRRVEIQIIEN